MTVDLLTQLPYAEVISDQLRTNARQALRAINRFLVCELGDLLPKGQNGNGGAPEPGPEATARPGPQDASVLLLRGRPGPLRNARAWHGQFL